MFQPYGPTNTQNVRPVNFSCELDHNSLKNALGTMPFANQSIDLMTNSHLPWHQPAPLCFNQSRHHLIRLDLISYIPSNPFDPKHQSDLQKSAT